MLHPLSTPNLFPARQPKTNLGSCCLTLACSAELIEYGLTQSSDHSEASFPPTPMRLHWLSKVSFVEWFLSSLQMRSLRTEVDWWEPLKASRVTEFQNQKESLPVMPRDWHLLLSPRQGQQRSSAHHRRHVCCPLWFCPKPPLWLVFLVKFVNYF
jgi:hypothetical protein